jgi:spermidine/putrescine-binding protein
MWNFDSVTYLPEFLPYTEEGGTKTTMSYSELWNTEWKGRAGMQDEGLTVFSETCNELEAEGEIDPVANITNLEDSEVDMIYNFLLPIVEAGQIKTFWFNYADIVHLLSTKELYLSSTWQPPCFDTRKAGTPAYYARLVNGPFFWYNSNYVSNETDPAKLEDCYKLMNWTLELYMSMLYTRQGYPTPACYYDDYKNGMGDEFYDWFHNGKATYLPIDEIMTEIWPDNPEFADLEERLQNALFMPDEYFKHFWTGEAPRTGSPHTRGNLRDIGSNEDKMDITRYFLSPDLPDNNDYYVSKYEELKAHMPV